MANTPRDDRAASDLGQRLTNLRASAGDPSYGHVSRWIYKHCDVEVSDNQIALLHTGNTDPHNTKVEILLSLIRFYEVTPAELGPVAEHRMHNVLVLADFRPDGGPDNGLTQGFNPLSWTDETAGQVARLRRPLALAS